jgi:alginate O-acetyltransferase complex protein AlgI
LLANALGINYHPAAPDIILPVGISFYTFQSLSYTLDMYRRKIEPEKSLLDFFFIVTFFPQLVAGPIVRPDQLLPQFKVPHQANRSHLYRLIITHARIVYEIVLADVFLSSSADLVFGLQNHF